MKAWHIPDLKCNFGHTPRDVYFMLGGTRLFVLGGGGKTDYFLEKPGGAQPFFCCCCTPLLGSFPDVADIISEAREQGATVLVTRRPTPDGRLFRLPFIEVESLIGMPLGDDLRVVHRPLIPARIPSDNAV